jgi:hypothetical protein
MSDRTTAQELSDVFYGLQIIVKIIEGLSQEYDNGGRTQTDYEQRFHSQVGLLCKALGDVRPLAEKLISDGYTKYERRTNSPVSDSGVLVGGGGGLAEGERLQDS